MNKFSVFLDYRCSMDCVYCFQDGSSDTSIEEEEYSRIIDYLVSKVDYSIPTEIKILGGDPLTAWKSTMRFLNDIKSLGILGKPTVIVTLSTSFKDFSSDIDEFLVDHKGKVFYEVSAPFQNDFGLWVDKSGRNPFTSDVLPNMRKAKGEIYRLKALNYKPMWETVDPESIKGVLDLGVKEFMLFPLDNQPLDLQRGIEYSRYCMDYFEELASEPVYFEVDLTLNNHYTTIEFLMGKQGKVYFKHAIDLRREVPSIFDGYSKIRGTRLKEYLDINVFLDGKQVDPFNFRYTAGAIFINSSDELLNGINFETGVYLTYKIADRILYRKRVSSSRIIRC